MRFIQIHSLTSYPASLLNRDDAGLAKRIPFGGAVRTRISSQCLKRHWRTTQDHMALKRALKPGEEMSVRSRWSFDEYVYKPLLRGDVQPDMARAVTDAVMTFVLTGKVEKSRKPADSLKSEQVTVFGRAELDFLCQEAKAICTTLGKPEDAAKAVNEYFRRERKQNIESMRLSAGPDAAMFGRFVTGDLYADVDAAVHVAHAMTVHQEESESDYFSAVDDLQYLHPEEGHGAGHINSSELTTGLYYGYVVIDVPLLVENLSGDRALATEITRRMVHLIATVSPGAKLGSTAPYAYADLVLIEKGDSQPRQLANAFLTPVSLRGDILAGAYAALAAHLKKLDTAFGRTRRKALILGKLPDDKEPHPLDDVLDTGGGEISASLSELAKWVASDQEAV